MTRCIKLTNPKWALTDNGQGGVARRSFPKTVTADLILAGRAG